ncbi:MAG: helix-turn-helix domain-containing protein [Oscillospiraceae bacterium]|nr:helix-turn-helix domain-containing protein [Oscillospiraceae bacterium]
MDLSERDQEIGLKIKQYRKGKMTQKELADKIGKTESSVCKYEKGLVTIPLNVLDEIATALGVTTSDLLETDHTEAESDGKRIRKYRKLRGLTQEELAKMTGLSTMSIRRYESGERIAPQPILIKIARTLGVHLRDLKTNPWSKFNEIIDSEALAKEVKEIEAIEVYLKSIGYTFEVLTSSDGEDCLLELSKDGNTVDFTEKEFDDFRERIKESVEYQIWKKQQK